MSGLTFNLTSAAVKRRKKFTVILVEVASVPPLLILWFTLHGSIPLYILLTSIIGTLLITQVILFTVLHFMFKYVFVISDKPSDKPSGKP